MEIIRAEKMGFCFGVQEAVNLVEKVYEAEKGRKIFVLGMLVHNSEVVNGLQSKGIFTIGEDELEKLSADDVIIIRAHGITRDVMDKLEHIGVKIYDATCVFVKKIKEMLEEYQKKGYNVIFVGDKNHPEVKGIISYGDNIKIVEKAEELENYQITGNTIILAQTTLNRNEYLKVKELYKGNEQVKIMDTICGATFERQKAVEKLAAETDCVIVVGGKSSSNTRKLFEISKKINNNTYCIETKDDLNIYELKNVKKIGITSGASTPEKSVKDVENFLKEEHLMENMENFEELLGQYLPSVERGEVKKGVILRKDTEFGYLDIGSKGEAKLRVDEVEGYNPGDEIDVVVLSGEEDRDGVIRVSRRLIEMKQNWDKLQTALQEKSPVEGKITKKVNGGYIVDIMKYDCFMPGSMSLIKEDEEGNYLGKKMMFMIKDISETGDKKKIVVSRREIKNIQVNDFMAGLAVGNIVDAVVKEVLKFGLTVDLGVVNGFIHISEVSWKRVDELNGMFKAGDKITAKIIELENQGKNKNIKLSIKQVKEDPKALIETKYKEGDEITAKVVKLEKFGAFAELEEGLEGLIHVSDLSWSKKAKNVEEYLKLGDIVKAKIVSIDPETKKIKLGLKQITANPWEEVAKKYPVGTTVTGKVVDIKEFGLFVNIEEGIDMFIHISDIKWTAPSVAEYKAGDAVTAKILELDMENQKIKAGIKQTTENPWEKVFAEYSVGDIIDTKVVKIEDFALFVEIKQGIEGMIHISEASKDFIKKLNEKFNVGDVVKAEIISMEQEKRKIKLSAKKVENAVEKAEEKELLEKYSQTV